MEVTIREYEQLLWGHRKIMMEQWEIARWQQFFQAQISPYLKARPHRPEDILRLDGDKPRKVVNGVTTKAEQEELERIFARIRKKRQ